MEGVTGPVGLADAELASVPVGVADMVGLTVGELVLVTLGHNVCDAVGDGEFETVIDTVTDAVALGLEVWVVLGGVGEGVTVSVAVELGLCESVSVADDVG